MNLVSIDKLLDDIQKRAAEVAPQGLTTGTATGGLHQDKQHASVYVGAFTQSIPVPELVYYHSLNRAYVFPTRNGGYTQLAMLDAMSHLQALGLSREDAAMKLAAARYERAVDPIRAIAGYQAGMVQQRDKWVLVPAGPALVEPRQGEWATIQKLIERPLGEDAFYVYALLKLAVEGLRSGGRKSFPLSLSAGRLSAGSH